jgi:hypothetical protein
LHSRPFKVHAISGNDFVRGHLRILQNGRRIDCNARHMVPEAAPDGLKTVPERGALQKWRYLEAESGWNRRGLYERISYHDKVELIYPDETQDLDSDSEA